MQDGKRYSHPARLFRLVRSKPFKRLTIGFWSFVAAGFFLICIWGTQNEHRGWVVPQGNDSGSTVQTYQCQLISGSKLFRGNDLFVVKSPRIVEQSYEILESQSWDPHDGKGNVKFNTQQPLDSDAKIPVAFSLSFRWAKILPILICVIGLIALIRFCRLMMMDPGILRERKVVLSMHGMLMIGTIFYVMCIVGNPGWKYGDNTFIIESTVQGEQLQTMIFPELGRFFPLGLVDLNLLIPFGDSPLIYLIERAILFLLLVGIVYGFASRRSGLIAGTAVSLAFLFAPGLFQVYSDSIFPEALLCVLLALFFAFYFSASESGNKTQMILACVCAALATYCKEPVFGLLVVFAMVQLLFGFLRQRKGLLLVNWFLLLNGAVFLGAYWMICGGGESYADMRNAGTDVTRLGSLFTLLGSHPWFVLSGFLAIWRLKCLFYDRFKSRDQNQLVNYDSALLAGVAYVMAFAVVRLTADYYIVPAYICFAFAWTGYLGQIFANFKSTEEQDDYNVESCSKNWMTGRARWLAPIGLSTVILISIYHIPQSFSSIHEIHTARRETRLVAETIAELESQGYRFYSYLPETMETHDVFMQDYRTRVLNVFNSKQLGEGASIPNHGDSPFEKLDNKNPDIAFPSGKWIVLHDPKYSIKPLNDRLSGGEYFQQMHAMPNLLGGRLYSVTSQSKEIGRIARSVESSIY